MQRYKEFLIYANFRERKKVFFYVFFSLYLHISKIITNFAVEFTPMLYFAAEGGGFFTY